mgnify:CR=1 FL=1|jgi:predicted nucleic acid binding AN1-type Zn finger protein
MLNLSPRKSIKKNSIKLYSSSKNIVSRNNLDDKNNINDPPVKNGNRCYICNIKVGLLGFQCKCDKIKLFCSLHRNPTDHNCNFDFKENAKKLLEKYNPKIIADKIDKL